MNIHTRKRTKKSAKNGFVYEYYFWFDGDRYSDSGYETERLAKEAGRAHYKNLGLGKEPQRKYRCPLSFSQVANEFLVVGATKLADNTRKTYRFQYNKIAPYIGDMKIWKIDYRTLQVAFNKLGISFKEDSNWVMRAAINAVFRYAIKMDYIEKNPVPLVEVSGSKKSEDLRCIEKHDFEQLYTRFISEGRINYKSYGVAIAIGYYTGMRKAEIFGLLRKNVDFDNKLIYVKTQLEYSSRKQSEFCLTEFLKTDTSEGVVPIPDQLIKILKWWLSVAPESDMVICDKNGSFLNPAFYGNRAKEWAQEIGFKFTFHMLRHSYATNLVMNGVNVKVAQKLLRHSNPSTTLRFYTHTQNNDLKDAVNVVFG